MFANLDKKKKIIIGVVFVAALGILILIMSLILFPKMKESNDKLILTPNVDEKQLEEKSKLEIYNQDEKDLKKYFSKDGKYGIDTELPEDEKLLQGQLQNFDDHSEENDYTKRQERYMKALSNISSQERSYPSGSSYSSGSGYSSGYGSDSENSLNKIFELQNKIRSGLAENAVSGNSQDSVNTSKTKENKKNLAKNDRDQKNFFQGTTAGSNKKILQLIPSETIEQKRILDKSIIPIRIKEDMRLSDIPGGLVIPKNTIIYGRISLGEDRINIDIESYKKDNILYLLNFRVYDYDGREGIHMNNHSWLKIPSTVSKDVFDYAIERGTNASGSILGGTNTGVDLKEARNLAILSAGKEISKEVFEKKRVFLPKKYQLWINIRSSNNNSVSN